MLRVLSRIWKTALIVCLVPQFSFAQRVRYDYLFMSSRYQFAQSLDERGFVDFAICEPQKDPKIPVCRSLSGGHNLTEEEVQRIYSGVASKLYEEARRHSPSPGQHQIFGTPLVAGTALALFLVAAGYTAHKSVRFKFVYPTLALLSVTTALGASWLLAANHNEVETSLREELNYYSNKLEVGESIRNEDVSDDALLLIAKTFEDVIHSLP